MAASFAASPSSSSASSSPHKLAVQVAAVIVGANFLILLVYNAAWKSSSYHLVPAYDDSGGGGGGVVQPSPLPMFLSNLTQKPPPEKPRSPVAWEGVTARENGNSNASPIVITERPATPPPKEPERKVDLASLEATMSERRETMQRGCAEMKSRSAAAVTRNYGNVIVMQEKHLAWCPVFKASSSTWLNYLFESSSLKEAKKKELREKYHHAQPLKLLVPVSTRLSMTQYKRHMEQHPDTSSFIIVRHPFNRLVSAFRDKIERSHNRDYGKDFYYRTYGKPIVAKFRKAATDRFGEKYFSAENNYGSPVPVHGFRTAAMPSFWEFVQYVKSSGLRMDEHWVPMTRWCSPCSIDYDRVIRFESIGEEGEYLKHVIDPTHRLRTDWVNPNNPTGMSNEDLTRLYFEQLSDSDINALYKIYEFDFKIFGYTFEMRNITLPY